MLSDATKRYRDVFALGLIGVSALILLSGISLLFKSGDDLGGAGFSEKAMLFGPVFTSLAIIAPLVLAVVIATVEEASKNARTVVLTALGVGGAAAFFAVITWFASYGVESEGFGAGFGGVFGAGKIVGTLLNLAAIGLIGLALLFIFSVYQGFPKPVPAQQEWGQQQGWGQQGWGQGGQQQGWGQHQGYTAGGWGDQSQAQAQQQGQPASAWDRQADQPGQTGPHSGTQQGWSGETGQHAAEYQRWGGTAGQSSAGQEGWGGGERQGGSRRSEQSGGWGQPAEQPAQQWGSTGAEQSAADETQVWGGETGSEKRPEESEQSQQDDGQKPQQGWWQQQ